MKNITLILSFLVITPAFAQDSDSPLVSFSDYENLMVEVKEHRKTRLVKLGTFNQMSTQDDVYILDTRSKEMYDRSHVKGAVHLNFSDFTQANLDALFPNRNATILIYCNNNFMDRMIIDPITSVQRVIPDLSYISKASIPEPVFQLNSGFDIENIQFNESGEYRGEIVAPVKSITLALNIPTYINLYGYGYRNVYELSELISVHDPRIQFEGSDVLNASSIEN